MNSLDVIIHKKHTVIILQQGNLFRELDYCEKQWYLEGKKGPLGAVRALFWPTTSGVGDRLYEKPRWQRDPVGLSRRWTFSISDENLDNLEAFIQSEQGEPLDGLDGWFRGKTSYHMFHNCYHFAARILKAAGLATVPWWAFSEKLIAAQLDNLANGSPQLKPTNQALRPIPVKEEELL